MDDKQKDESRPLTMWLDLVDGFDGTLQKIGRYYVQAGEYVSMRGPRVSVSAILSVALQKLLLVVDTLTDEQLRELEAHYLAHRARKTTTTSVQFYPPTVVVIDQLAKKFHGRGLAYVYHGKSPNRKMISLCAVYYVLNTHITPSQQAK